MRGWMVMLILMLGLAGPARAQTPVDTALILAVDASGSISPAEFALQREGIRQAVTDPQVLAAIRSGPFARLAIAYVEWGGPGMAQTMVGWHLVEDPAGAEAFGRAVLAAHRSIQSWNAIGDAIDHAVSLFDTCPCAPMRRVIDISGDNPDANGLRPVMASRDAAVAAGITINALAVVHDGEGGLAGGDPWLVTRYRNEVIGGPGAFVLPARSRADFARALRDKMVLEIAGTAPGPHRRVGRSTEYAGISR